MSWESDARKKKRLRYSIWMRGWDDALIGNRSNPYYREDYRDLWERGYKRCMENKPLPSWYEWWKSG